MADNNDYIHAIQVLSDGLRVNPLDTELLINRAGYYTCQGQFGLAINDYSSCLRHRPDTLDAWKYRANARFALGDIVGSISDYQCALRIDQEEISGSLFDYV